jgi:hypothetical protein
MMAQVSHPGTEADGAPAGQRRRRKRGRELAGLAIGIAAGLAIALAWLVPMRSHPPPPGPVLIPGPTAATANAAPDPAALDAQWIAYSDQSSCADWAGGDGVSAVRLNSSQLAWFFSDTSIGPAGPAIGFSQLSGFVHNSLVIQTATAKGSAFVTMTGGGACTGPGGPGNAAPVVGPPPAVPGGPSDRYWDEDGITIGGTIVKFYNHYRAGLQPYVPLGTAIATFDVSQLSEAGRGPRYGAVARPRLIPLPSYTPPGGGGPIVWGAALLQAGNMVYVYGTQSPNVHASDALLYLARVPASQLTSFDAWRFYTGQAGQASRPGDSRWAAGQRHARPVQPASSGLAIASGFSVVHIGDRYWLIQIGPALGTTDIDAYPARTPWGPFDYQAGRLLYRDPSIGLDAAHEYRIMYEARAEPALSTGSTLVISYNVNSEAVTAGCAPMSEFTNTVILPRFIAVPMAAFGDDPDAPAKDAPASTVRSGPPDYPPIVQQNPSQWFDAWTYPGDCPPVPRPKPVQARPGPGKVTLSWPDLGLNISYRVYLQGPGNARTMPAKTDGATVTGLRPGTYTAKVVPVNFYQHTGPAAEVTFTVP